MPSDDAPTALVTGPDVPPPGRPYAARAAAAAVRLAVYLALATILALPVAAGWAVTHTVVRETVGTTPTTFTLTTRAHSELRLGIPGTIYVPRSAGPFGIVASVEGPGDPGAGDGDLANYVSPEMLELYTGIFHDPGPAIEQYVGLVRAEARTQFLGALLLLGGAGGLVLFTASHLVVVRPVSSRQGRLRIGLAGGLALCVTTSLGAAQVLTADTRRGPTEGVYPLTVLDDTLAAGATTDSPLIRALTGGALAKARSLIDRQEQAEARYRATAEEDLESQRALLAGPREGETAVLMQSDMHCNTTMIRLQSRVVAMLGEQFGAGVPALMAITGDLTTNGTAAEGVCITGERAIVGDAPVAVVTGNHESDVSARQMADAGMTVLDGSSEELAGVRVLGDGDPSRSELFGGTRLRGEEGQVDVGERLRDEAVSAGPEDRPDLVLVHEAYAAQAFLGVDSVDALLTHNDVSLTQAPEGGDDGIDDVPAGAVLYGHWHRSIEPRVIWNSDGSWTLLMELDTSGGAIDSPTLNNFSTPWSKPQQEASFPVLFLDDRTGLVTGYQLFRFATDGTARVERRVDIGTVPAFPGAASTRADEGPADGSRRRASRTPAAR